MIESLRSCPFCGGKAAVKQTAVQCMETNRDSARFDFVIECLNCHARAPGGNGYVSVNLARDGELNAWHNDRPSAVASWNQRAE